MSDSHNQHLLNSMKLRLLKTTLLWIVDSWFADLDRGQLLVDLSAFMKLIGRLVRTRGLKWTITYLKTMRLAVTRYLSGAPLKGVPFKLGLQKDGFPKSINFLQKYIDSGEPQKIRFVLTLMVVSRAMRAEGTPNYGSITDPFSGEFTTIDKSFVERFVRDYELSTFRPVLTRESLFFTMKGGPFGLQILTAIQAIGMYNGTIWSALQHIIGMQGCLLLKDLWMSHRKKISNKVIEDKLVNLSKIAKKEVPLALRRLSIVNDPELKARVVCLVDYFTQVVLEPLSKQFFDMLRKFPQDRTFTQDPHIVEREAGHKYHSFDLSSATDRFPLDLQKQLLGEIHSKPMAWAWGALMVSQPVVTPEGDLLKYSVGQPMGARSSWAMFTLTHHMVVQYAAFLVGKYPTRNYILLGDDIVITDDTIAEKYVELITGLGVEISKSKTHVSRTTYEFAKRWFHAGVEVTGFPVNAAYSTLKSPLELFGAVYEIVQRGFVPSHFRRTDEVVCRLYSVIWAKQTKRLSSLRNTLWNFRFTLRNLHHFHEEEVREFFARATSNGSNNLDETEYVIPAQAVMLESELSRVASAAVNGMSMSILKNLSTYWSKLLKSIDTLHGTSISASDLLADYPLFVAITNSVKRIVTITSKFNKWGDLLPFIEEVKVVDIDRLVEKRRDTIHKLYLLRVFGSTLYNQLRSDPAYAPNITRNFQVLRVVKDLDLASTAVLRKNSWSSKSVG